MFKTILLCIPELLAFLFAPPSDWSNMWKEFKENMAEHEKQEARRKAREPVRPDVNGCTGTDGFFMQHRWEHMYGGWNSGIYDYGAVGRSGWRCYHCSDVHWDQTDEEFVKAQPDFLLIQASSIPEEFIQHFTTELLQKRCDYQHDKKVHALMQEQKHHRERLAELDEVEQNGGMLLTGNT